jgi:hypothetical protein
LNIRFFYFNLNLNFNPIFIILRFGTSGNKIMDQFISKNNLKWIPYKKFKNVKYFAEGGFGIIYKATYDSYRVIFKCPNCLNNNSSDENLNKFLNKV